ncbi:MAG: 3-oxoacyl-[acyl-carrier-protein] reductase [Clostridia bacterium]|nr:3-oxoacyl-[acyl-carrier-protein] reductase [Clostridia bacterium]
MLEGKKAIITGASRGIGRAIAIDFARNGATVALIYADNSEAAAEVVTQIKNIGSEAFAYQCDVRSFEDTKKTVKDIINNFSGIDILVNNAGITRDGLMLTMSEENFNMVMDTNLKGTFHMIRHLYSHMMKQRKGRIINMASVAGVMGNAGQSNYAGAKAGIIGLTKSVAKELASRNVTCNAIAPGFIQTDMTAKLSDRVVETALQQIPLKRMGYPEEVAKLATFLASDNAAYITGQVIQIDGGLCM